MKTGWRVVGVILLAVVTVWPAAGSDVRDQIGKVKYDLAVANLLVGLRSDNCGLCTSSVYMLGELKAGKAIIPLMNVLRTSDNECVRIAAAWALCRIGDGRGTFAVKQAARFDRSDKVRARCAWYYNLYVQEGTFSFVPPVQQSAEMTSK